MYGQRASFTALVLACIEAYFKSTRAEVSEINFKEIQSEIILFRPSNRGLFGAFLKIAFFSRDRLEREIRKDQTSLAAKCPT